MKHRTALAGACVLAVAVALLVSLYDLAKVPSDSMEPELRQGDYVVSGWRGDVSGYAVGDVVVVDATEWMAEATGLKLRITGMPGDLVAVGADGRLVVDGAVVDADAAAEGIAAFEAFTVPEGRVFLLADNQGLGRDSLHYFEAEYGTLPLEAVEARVHAVAAPVGEARLLPLDGSRDWALAGLPLLALLGAIVLVTGVTRSLRASRSRTAVPASR